MKISPISGAGTAVSAPAPDAPQTMIQKIRSVRMNTNATPGRIDPAENLSIPDPADTAIGADEATKPLSPQFAALAKQKRALQVKEREIQDREKALAANPTQGAGVDIAQLKADPLGTLLKHGVSYEQLTQAVLANREKAPFQALEDKIKALEEGLDKKFTERDTGQKQQALAEMKREADLLAATGADFELVRETKSVPQVIELIERTYDESGEVLDVREALRLVEDQLLKDNLRFASLEKVQSQLAPRPAPPPSQPQRPMRTLTNRDTAQVPLSAKARALAAFNGTLRK